jgi:non-ribosomal peptide synthetase component E (peptide arylation enzyme)
MPDPDLGEVVCAYIKLVRGTSITLEEIVAHLTKTEASRVLYPARIEVVEEMPLTAAGKADKKILKKDIEGKLKNP